MIDLKKLNELNRYHRIGFDQTANYMELFEGNRKAVELAKIDALKVRVRNGAFYLSRKKSLNDDEYLLIDMYRGDVYKIDSKLYRVKVDDDKILAIDNFTDEEHFLLVGGKLDLKNIIYLGKNNYTKFSCDKASNFEGYPALRFNNSYEDSIRVHRIIALMKWGMGILSTHKVKFTIPYTKSLDNSILNLKVVLGK